MHRIQADILRKLTHTPQMGFSELWDKQGPSNNFTYHLNALVEEGKVAKEGDTYALTSEGKREVAYFDGKTGEKEKAPLIVVVIVVCDKDRYLMLERGREPFYGYWGFVGGKLRFSQYLLECARAELFEETGLECDLELKGLFSSKTFNGEDLAYNHQIFIFKGTNPKGTVLETTREGKNAWVTKEDIEGLRTLPNVPCSLAIIESEGFRWIEADRIQEGDEFKDMRILRDERI